MNRAWATLLYSVVTLTFCPFSSHAGEDARALVIIDMQKYFMSRNHYDEKSENKEKVSAVFQAQLLAIKAAKETRTPIIFIEYERYGSTDDQLKKAASDTKGEVVYFLKNSDGMFEDRNIHRQDLNNYLGKNKIKTLIVVGANGGACVKASINGAIARDLNVIAYDKGIIDFNYANFIYPYDHYFKETIETQCKDCTFRETSELTDIFPTNLSALKKSAEVRKVFDKLKPPAKGCDK